MNIPHICTLTSQCSLLWKVKSIFVGDFRGQEPLTCLSFLVTVVHLSVNKRVSTIQSRNAIMYFQYSAIHLIFLKSIDIYAADTWICLWGQSAHQKNFQEDWYIDTCAQIWDDDLEIKNTGILFKLEYSCFTLLCQFLLYSKWINHMYTHVSSLDFFPI